MTNITKDITCHVNIKLLEMITIEFIWHGAILYFLNLNFIKNKISFKCYLAEKLIHRKNFIIFLFVC